MADFPTSTIEIRYASDNWGPFTFEFENLLPEGDAISSITIKAFEGSVSPGDDIDDLTDIASYLVDSDDPPAVSNDTDVLVYFKYPGDDYADEKYTLVFELTLDSGAVHPFYFSYVKVKL